MTTGKSIALTRWTFVGKVMSLLFNMLSGLALESITMNKASGGDGIPTELFQILKDDAAKVLQSHVSKFGKLSSGHRTEEGQFSFQ